MRQPVMMMLCLGGTIFLSACAKKEDPAEVQKALKNINVIEESNLSDVMLNAGDPDQAVAYFQKTLADNPGRIDLMRGLAKSLVRANKPHEAVAAWKKTVASGQSTPEDKVALADAYIRTNNWTEAQATLNTIPPTHETYERYRLEAMVADSKRDWKKADSFYETAVGLTTKPAGVLNNWGYSKLTRRDFAGAERLFIDALTYDPGMFTAKNNLVLARGGQRKYDLPVVEMTQSERAELLYTAGLTAVKQGDVTTGRQMIKEALDTHPQYFEAAARALEAMDAGEGVTAVAADAPSAAATVPAAGSEKGL